MPSDTQALGTVQKEEGQAKELEEAGQTVLNKPKGKNAEGEKTPKEVEKNQGKEKPAEKPEETTEPSHEDNVKLLQEENEKLTKRVKDQESFIGKTSSEMGELRKIVDTVKNATTVEEKKEAKSKVQEAYDNNKKNLISQGYSETEAENQLKPMLDMVKGAEEERKQEAKERRIQEVNEKMSKAEEYVKNSKDINLNLYMENQAAIVEELGNINPSLILKNPEKAVLKAYRTVLREKADKMRKANKSENEETRENDIAGQASPSPKSKGKAEDSKEYSAENILNASSGRIFET